MLTLFLFIAETADDPGVTTTNGGFTTSLPSGCNTDIEDPTTPAYYELKRVFLIVVRHQYSHTNFTSMCR